MKTKERHKPREFAVDTDKTGKNGGTQKGSNSGLRCALRNKELFLVARYQTSAAMVGAAGCADLPGIVVP